MPLASRGGRSRGGRQENNEIVEPVIESINFEDENSRLSYLQRHFDELLSGINDNYGKELMEELMSRLEKTVEEYHHQMTVLLKELKTGEIRNFYEEEEETVQNSDVETETDQDLTAEMEEQIIKRMQQRSKK
jgi:signal recognition particle GTPase